ncbi:hypothetical protein DIPPA_19732 [Diplonema papillatum]|nr:hypothetical protein DIPPA_19732 [Diplonema papillatum]
MSVANTDSAVAVSEMNSSGSMKLLSGSRFLVCSPTMSSKSDDEMSYEEPMQAFPVGRKKSVQFREIHNGSVACVMEKYSVGRVGTFRNWRTRYFTADHWCIEYRKKTSDVVPCGRICFSPATRLRTVVDAKVHPQACDPNYLYLMIEFDENHRPYTILLRTNSCTEYSRLASFLSEHVSRHDDEKERPERPAGEASSGSSVVSLNNCTSLDLL